MNEVLLEASQVPQADDLDRVVAYVRPVGKAGETPAEAGFAGRDAQYYAHAARVLGLLDLEGELTGLGRRLLEAALPASVLVEAFEQTPLAEAWARELEADSVWEVASNSIVEILPEIASLADSTAHRRASTVWSRRAALLPVASDRPKPAQLREELLARPLDDLMLPTRLQNFAARAGLTTVRDLVALGRPALMSALHRRPGRRPPSRKSSPWGRLLLRSREFMTNGRLSNGVHATYARHGDRHHSGIHHPGDGRQHVHRRAREQRTGRPRGVRHVGGVHLQRSMS